MSRRREATELARALLLSTQEAIHISNLSPHLRSSKSSATTTQDSKDMELRPVETVAPRDVMRPPESSIKGDSSSSRREEMEGVDSTSGSSRSGRGQSTVMSAIQSFTPSNQQEGFLIPATNSAQNPPRGTFKPLHSSPMIPASKAKLSPTEVSQSGSSHRPVFSPTQTSAVVANSRPSEETPAARIRNGIIPSQRLSERRTGKDGAGKTPEGPTSSKAATPSRSGRQYLLSMSPPEPAGNEKKDHESSDEVEEEIEERPPLNKGKEVEVVVPSRDRSKSRPVTRRDSPDPLDSIPSGKSKQSASKEPPSTSKTSNIASSIASTSQQSTIDGGERRASRRVADAKAKEEAEKEERRRKRRLEKEAKAREEEEGKKKPETKGKATRESRMKAREQRTAEPEEKNKKRTRRGEYDPDMEFDDESIPPLRLDIQKTSEPGVSKEMEEEESIQVTEPPTKKTNKRTRRIIEDDEDEGEKGTPSNLESLAPVEKKTKSPTPAAKKADKRLANRSKQKNATPPAEEDDKPGEEDEEEGAGSKETNPVAEKPVDEEAEVEISKESTKPPPPLDIESRNIRPPLAAVPPPNTSSPLTLSHRPSPGPGNRPGGIKWKTSRDDLSSVLSKFQGSKLTGMSRRAGVRIAPLHMKIGPGVKSLPPVPVKPSKKKKGESDDEEEEEENGEGEGSDDEHEGGGKEDKKLRKKREWLMMED